MDAQHCGLSQYRSRRRDWYRCVSIELWRHGRHLGHQSARLGNQVRWRSGGSGIEPVPCAILTFYLLRDWDSILEHLGALLPSEQRQTIVGLAKETDEVLGAFLRGQLLVMMALSFIYSVGLGLVGLKFAVAIGVVSGLVSFVPYLGFVFGIALAGLTVALEPDPLWLMAGVIATFSIAQFLEGSVLTPKLVGDRIGLHPVIIIFAVAAGGQLFGFFGILLALPAAAVLSVLVRFAYHRYLKEHPEIAVEEAVDGS